MKKPLPKIEKQTEIWTTKDGRRIRICDMSDRHLRNTLALLDRKADINARSYLFFSPPRGEMAFDGWERETNFAFEASSNPSLLFPIYSNLKKEKLRRELAK